MRPARRSRSGARRSSARRAGGATLVDVLLSVFFLGLFLGAVQQFSRTMLRGVRVLEVASEAQEAARVGVQLIAADLREAGFSPDGALAAGVLAAEPDAVRIARDLSGDGDTGDANELVGYSYAADARALMRSMGSAPPQPLLNDVADGGLQLTYFTADGALLPAPSGGLDAAARARIRRVHVRLAIEIPHPDPQYDVPIRAEQTATVSLRNGR